MLGSFDGADHRRDHRQRSEQCGDGIAHASPPDSSSSSSRMRAAEPSGSSNWPLRSAQKNAAEPEQPEAERDGDRGTSRTFTSRARASRSELPITISELSRHCERGDQRRHQPGHRQRHGEHVVADRQREILPHDAHRRARGAHRARHTEQRILHEHHIRRLLPDVARRAGRHRDARQRQRRAVVEPVTDHQHLACRCALSASRSSLLLVGRAGAGLRGQAGFARNRLRLPTRYRPK